MNDSPHPRPLSRQRERGGTLTPGPSPAARERGAAGGVRATLVSTPLQARFLTIPEAPLCYWLRERFFELLAGRTLGEVADVCQGLATADDERFVRFVWEVRPEEWARPLRERRWVPFEKGGGYGKWFGHHWWVVDWEDNGARIKASPGPRVQNEQHYFREGWTYSYMARGSLGLRCIGSDTIFSHLASAIFFHDSARAAAVVNCRFASSIVRSLSAKIQLNESYVARLPLPERIPDVLGEYEAACVALKRWLVARDPTERTFGPSPLAPLPQAGEGWRAQRAGVRVESGTRWPEGQGPDEGPSPRPSGTPLPLRGRGDGGEGGPRGEGEPGGEDRARILRRESSPEIRELARLLRQAGNRAEDALWEALRDRRLLGLKFRRQHPLGPFIVDFYCAELRLVIEVDGSIHRRQDVQDHDQARDEWLAHRGVRIIRIPADTVLRSPEEALATIADAASAPSPLPLSRGAGYGPHPGLTATPLPLRGRGDGGEGGPRGEGGARGEGLLAAWRLATDEAEAVAALLHTLEGLSEREVFAAYRLDEDDIQAVLEETGTPAGWYPLIAGYDGVPPLPPGLSVASTLLEPLAHEPRRAPSPEELSRLKTRLRALYEAGPGARGEDAPSPLPLSRTAGEGEGGEGEEGEGDDEEAAVSGARIPIPAETFLEELSQKLEIHPISVYWLLKEMREQEGLVSPPLAKQAMEDYVSVTILRLLGYRWPEEALTPDSPLPPGGRGAGGEGDSSSPAHGRGAGGEGDSPSPARGRGVGGEGDSPSPARGRGVGGEGDAPSPAHGRGVGGEGSPPLPPGGRGAGGEGDSSSPAHGRGVGGEGSPPLPLGGRGVGGEGLREGPGVRAADDGILPLVPCGDQPTAPERVRMRLERDFGPEGAEQSEREFRQWVGRDLDDWLRRDFFKRHVQQFKQRPIAWHLVSPERTFEAFVLYHKLSRATLQKLRAQYAGGLITRLRAEQERARQRGAVEEVSRLQLQLEDVEEFRARLEQIERGDELRYRIRCRWKGEADSGRSGPYTPDIDDGVKVNIRPFQEAGLLAVKEVIKKW